MLRKEEVQWPGFLLTRHDLTPACRPVPASGSVTHMNGSYCSTRMLANTLATASRGIHCQLPLHGISSARHAGAADSGGSWLQGPLGTIVEVFASVPGRMVFKPVMPGMLFSDAVVSSLETAALNYCGHSQKRDTSQTCSTFGSRAHGRVMIPTLVDDILQVRGAVFSQGFLVVVLANLIIDLL